MFDKPKPYDLIPDAYRVMEWPEIGEHLFPPYRLAIERGIPNVVDKLIQGCKNACEAETYSTKFGMHCRLALETGQFDHPQFRQYLAAKLGLL